MTNALRYLDHVPDFIEFHLLRTSDVVQTSDGQSEMKSSADFAFTDIYCLESVPKMLLVLSGEPG